MTNPSDTPPAPALPASFYQLLERLLPRPEIGSVSFRGDADFEVLRLACTERMRRHPDVASLPIDEGFVVNVLDARSRWSEAKDAPDWMSWIQFWAEGIGQWRDVLVETPPVVGRPLSRLLAEGHGGWKVIVSFLEPSLAVDGYRWHQHPDGYAIGVRVDEKQILRAVEDWLP